MLKNASVGVGNSRAGRKRPEVTLRKLRSAITNGSSVLADIDHRSAWMRRLRDLIQLHMSDLGGDDNVSEAERSLVRRASMLELQCELLEQRFAQAEGGAATSAQLADYQRAAGTLRRLLTSLGLQRRARDVTPSLSEYLAQLRASSETEAESE